MCSEYAGNVVSVCWPSPRRVRIWRSVPVTMRRVLVVAHEIVGPFERFTDSHEPALRRVEIPPDDQVLVGAALVRVAANDGFGEHRVIAHYKPGVPVVSDGLRTRHTIIRTFVRVRCYSSAAFRRSVNS